ncbi:hypothetical protein SAE02_67960 [Skermanella aerolata]|uniref:Uncharacterized protein n=1 Tax=Skermanella aerolata TaxID=393310 RepID=A0A512E1Q5_9PROT|nr:hypothetical protein SAE02_67960 [Skermanella aerolata]
MRLRNVMVSPILSNSSLAEQQAERGRCLAKCCNRTLGDGHDPLPIGRAALEPAIDLALRYSAEQGSLPREPSLDEV